MANQIIPELDKDSEAYRKTSEVLQGVANGLSEIFPGMGFALMVFPFGGPEGHLNIVSNAAREDMLPTLKAWIANVEGRMMEEPKTPQ